MEKSDGYTAEKAEFFHAMEKVFGDFPCYGKYVYMVWNTRLVGRYKRVVGCFSRLLSGARDAP